jgi:hypothetical protein
MRRKGDYSGVETCDLSWRVFTNFYRNGKLPFLIQPCDKVCCGLSKWDHVHTDLHP